MEDLIGFIVETSLKNGIISSDDAGWFRYGIERRFFTFLIGIPFFVIAVVLSDFWVAVSFYVSFYMLRSRANGFHAKTIGQCFLFSLLAELFLFLVVYPLLNRLLLILLLSLSFFLVFFLAPFNHPNMRYTEEEILICKRSARIRIGVLMLLSATMILVNRFQIASGICLGCTMAGSLLCISYLSEWRNVYEKQTTKSNEKPFEASGNKDD